MGSKIDPNAKLPVSLFQNVLMFAGNLPFAARVSKKWSLMAKNPETERLFYRAIFQAYMRTPSLNLYVRRSLFFWKEGDQAYALIDRTIRLIWRDVSRIDNGLQCTMQRAGCLDPFSPCRLTKVAKQVEHDMCESSILFFERLAVKFSPARKRQNTLQGKPIQKAIDIRTWCEENRALLSGIKELDLRGIGLTFLPAEICFFPNLERFNASNNFLTSLPQEIALLSKLTTLELRNNTLLKLPREIGLLQNLQHLVVSHNMLTCLPVEIAQLTQLTLLHLEGNCFIDFPREVCLLPSLLELNLAMNRIVELPESIRNLRSLVHLYLNDNRLHYLPAELAKLKALIQLDVRANDQSCFAASELLCSDNPTIQNALLAAELYDSTTLIVSFFSTAFFRGLLSLTE